MLGIGLDNLLIKDVVLILSPQPNSFFRHPLSYHLHIYLFAINLLQHPLFKLNGGTTVIVDTSSFICRFPVDMVDVGNEDFDTILGGAAVVHFILVRMQGPRSKIAALQCIVATGSFERIRTETECVWEGSSQSDRTRDRDSVESFDDLRSKKTIRMINQAIGKGISDNIPGYRA